MASKRPAVRFRYAPQVGNIQEIPLRISFYVSAMTPSQIGERAEAALTAALVSAGKSVYLPFGGSQRCDLIFEDGDGLHRVQVKNGVLRDRVVNFNTCSNTNNVPKDYIGQIDFFGVYCHELGTAFLVPITAVPPTTGRLRIAAPRSNQQRNIRWAEQFRLEWSPPALRTDAGAAPPPE
jgi:PD-(D/E)XK endonuclease